MRIYLRFERTSCNAGQMQSFAGLLSTLAVHPSFLRKCRRALTFKAEESDLGMLASDLGSCRSRVYRASGRVQLQHMANSVAEAFSVDLVRSAERGRLVLCRDRRPHVPSEKEADQENNAENKTLRTRRVILAHSTQGKLSIPCEVLDTISAKLVVDQTSEGDRVAEELERSDWVPEDDHRGHDEQDVLQHTRQSENNGGCFADLRSLVQTRVL